MHKDSVYRSSNKLHELLGANDIKKLSEETFKQALELWKQDAHLRTINPSKFELEKTLRFFIKINQFQRDNYENCKGI